MRRASHGEVESWLRVIREAATAAPPAAVVPKPAGPVKKLSKRFLDQQKLKGK